MVFTDKLSVNIDISVVIGAVKVQDNLFAFKFGRHREHFSVPACAAR